MSYIQFPSGEFLDVSKIIAFVQQGNRTRFECVDGITKFGVYNNEDEATIGLALHKSIIFETATADAMQYIEDIFDTPQANPTDVTKPARYKQIGYAVFWEWSISESKWYPLVTA